jgi:metal-sulfur cluster biosynthetic enzyme
MSMGNPMAQTDPGAQRFGAAPPAQRFTGTDVEDGGSVAGADVLEALKDVIDPELGINIVDLGLVYGIRVDGQDNVELDMTLTTAACPLTDIIERQTDMVLSGLASSVSVNWVWMPAWGPERITDDGRDQLRAIGFNV